MILFSKQEKQGENGKQPISHSSYPAVTLSLQILCTGSSILNNNLREPLHCVVFVTQHCYKRTWLNQAWQEQASLDYIFKCPQHFKSHHRSSSVKPNSLWGPIIPLDGASFWSSEDLSASISVHHHCYAKGHLRWSMRERCTDHISVCLADTPLLLYPCSTQGECFHFAFRFGGTNNVAHKKTPKLLSHDISVVMAIHC